MIRQEVKLKLKEFLTDEWCKDYIAKQHNNLHYFVLVVYPSGDISTFEKPFYEAFKEDLSVLLADYRGSSLGVFRCYDSADELRKVVYYALDITFTGFFEDEDC